MSGGGDSKSLPAAKPYCYECAKSSRVCSTTREGLERLLTDNGKTRKDLCACGHSVNEHRTTTELQSAMDRRRVLDWTVEDVGLFIRSLDPRYEKIALRFEGAKYGGKEFMSPVLGRFFYGQKQQINLDLLRREWNELRKSAGLKSLECETLADLHLITDRVRLPASEQGNMSCVETAIYNGRKVIIKTLKSAEPYDIKQFRAEIDALKSVKSHDLSGFVVELIAYCESPLALILEWCEGGSLYSHHKQPKSVMEETTETPHACMHWTACAAQA